MSGTTALSGSAIGTRTVVLACADAALRERLRATLAGLRWQVRVAAGGAEAMGLLEASTPEALLLDSWLPDLEVGEFAALARGMYPGIDLLRLDGVIVAGGARSPRRNELLHALREAQDDDGLEDLATVVEDHPAVSQTAAPLVEARTYVRDQVRDAVGIAGLPEMVGASAG